MSTQNEVINMITVANACTLATDVIMEIAGNDISNHLSGSPITRDTVNGLVQAVINKDLGGSRHAE